MINLSFRIAAPIFNAKGISVPVKEKPKKNTYVRLVQYGGVVELSSFMWLTFYIACEMATRFK